MKSLLVLLTATLSVSAAYTWDFQQSPVAADATHWQVNGSPDFQSYGVHFYADLNSMVYLPGISGASANDYEIQSTLKITSAYPSATSTYAHLVRTSGATANLFSGNSVQVQLIIPAGFTGNGSANLQVVQRTGSGSTLLGSATIAAHDGMLLRTVVFGSNLWVFTDSTRVMTQTISLSTGNPGIAGLNMPANNGFTGVKVGLHDVTVPITLPRYAVTYFTTPSQLSIHSRGGVDDVNGIGIWSYSISRSDLGSPLVFSTAPDFADSSVVPSTTYTYSVTTTDFHGNTSAPLTFSVTTPPASSIDPLRAGVRSAGSYWGGAGEQIDMRSGNVNFSIPLISPQGRTGWSMPLTLNSNSQFWRNESGNTFGSLTGMTIGYGSLVPFYAQWWAGPDHYTFTDASGSAYRLDVNTGGIWSSRESLFVWYDAVNGILHFRDGTSWAMSPPSSGANDSGAQYPLTITDSNGNQILITYATPFPRVEVWAGKILTIEDVRGKGSPTYTLNYSGESISSITSSVAPTENWTINWGSPQPITDPWGNSVGSTPLITSVTNAAGASWNFTYNASGTGELTQVNFPDGGHVKWAFVNATYGGNRQIREVSQRWVSNSVGGTEWGPYNFTHDDSANPNPTIHANTTLTDASGVGSKTWKFILPDGNSAHAWQVGLVSDFLQQTSPTGSVLTHDTNTWTQDSDGNPYVATKTSVMDEGQTYAKTSKVTQTLDHYGNVLSQAIYDYGSLTTAARTFTNTYLHTSSSTYDNAYIRNRLVSSTMADNAGHSVTTVTNTYDGGTLAAVSGGTPMEFDTVRGAATNHVRGNVTQSVSMGQTMTYLYDVTGQNTQGTNASGTGAATAYSSTTNFAAADSATPMAGTADAMNGHTPTQAAGSSLSSSYGYTNALALASSAMPNGATTSQNFSSTTGLLTSSVSVHGATTSYTYAFAPTLVTATTNAHYTKAWKDGFGRDLEVESGTGSTVVSHVKNVYGPCACSPLGKLVQTSMPYALGAGGVVVASDGSSTIAWNTWTYDGIGRTVTKTAADGSATAYVYQGNTTKVTDAAGKWKRFTSDVFGNLVQVEEPDPSTGVDSVMTNLVTAYTYDLEGHLTNVSMPRSTGTQTRSFNYDLPTGRLLSVTQPESGTTSYSYYASGRLQQKLDANGQKVVYSYDGYGRLAYVDRYPVSAANPDPCQSVALTYDGSTGNGMGRLSNAAWGSTTLCTQQIVENYMYTAGGLVTNKGYTVTVPYNNGTGANYSFGFQPTWAYDSEGHMTGYTDGAGTFSYTLDGMGRATAMTQAGAPNTTWVQNVVYGPAGELKSMQFRTSAGSYYTETRTWNSRDQMVGLTTSGTGLAGISLSYSYGAAGSNNGQIASITDALSGEQIAYTYDYLKRLVKAETVQNQTTYPSAPWWGQSFGYDGFGNLLTKAPTSGHSATTMSLTVNAATNRLTTSGFAYDANGNMTSMPTTSGTQTLAYDVENRTGSSWFDVENRPVTKNGLWQVYGLGGERLGQWYMNVPTYPAGTAFTGPELRNIYFQGRLIQANGETVVVDQIGSVRANEYGDRFEYYPYGEDFSTNAPALAPRFGTYTRDPGTGLDDANQRVYTSTYGAFSTPDRYQASASDSDPGTWNRYPYVGGDPVNYFDARGTDATGVNYAGYSNSGVCPAQFPFCPDPGLIASGAISAGVDNGRPISSGVYGDPCGGAPDPESCGNSILPVAAGVGAIGGIGEGGILVACATNPICAGAVVITATAAAIWIATHPPVVYRGATDPIAFPRDGTISRDGTGNCQRPPQYKWQDVGNDHGAVNGSHWHWIGWNLANASSCTYYPKRGSGPVDPGPDYILIQGTYTGPDASPVDGAPLPAPIPTVPTVSSGGGRRFRPL